MTIKEQAEQQSQMHGYMLESERQAFIQGFVEAKTIKEADISSGKHKINRSLIHNEQRGYLVVSRYSLTNETDDHGRWSRIIYYNGLCIGWINGFVKGEHDKLDHRRTGTVDFFNTSLFFPVNGQQTCGHHSFNNYEDAQDYILSMFYDFKFYINE